LGLALHHFVRDALGVGDREHAGESYISSSMSAYDEETASVGPDIFLPPAKGSQACRVELSYGALRGFCFSSSSQEVFWNGAEDFL
jgi:hypothetical protein